MEFHACCTFTQHHTNIINTPYQKLFRTFIYPNKLGVDFRI
jgi:hypothetical protein